MEDELYELNARLNKAAKALQKNQMQQMDILKKLERINKRLDCIIQDNNKQNEINNETDVFLRISAQEISDLEKKVKQIEDTLKNTPSKIWRQPTG